MGFLLKILSFKGLTSEGPYFINFLKGLNITLALSLYEIHKDLWNSVFVFKHENMEQV